MRRSRARSSPMVSSATAAELRPGTLATSRPLAAAAPGAMVLAPEPVARGRPARHGSACAPDHTMRRLPTDPSPLFGYLVGPSAASVGAFSLRAQGGVWVTSKVASPIRVVLVDDSSDLRLLVRL